VPTIQAAPPVETPRLSDALVIEDDDGFRTEWPFPACSSLLHQGDFIALCETLHDAARGDQP
jgi:hypothetical protein